MSSDDAPLRAPSGDQFEISSGEQRATIVEVGGGIRSYDAGTRPVLDAYRGEAICDGAHGAPLIPWPNRLADGSYRWDGVDQRLALTEPEQLSAIHGLLRWHPWRALEHASDRVVMGTRLHPQPGYPFVLDVSIEYALSDAGLSVTTAATNVGDRACPFASGQHPYLSPGAGLIDECVLKLEAQTWVATDARQLPVGRKPVAGTPLDFGQARRIGQAVIDCAFTDLARDDRGLATVTLTGADDATVELWADGSYPVIQLYTGDTLAPERQRRGLAAEPMTCLANAFQTGDGVVRLEPGATFTSRWGVGLL
jgi:aldose 1-epimerase